MTTQAPGDPAEALLLRDPRTGRVRGRSPNGRAPQVAATVVAARRASAAWRARTPRERADRLQGLADALDGHAGAYIARERAGTGKPEAEIAHEVAEAADLFRFYAGAARAGTAPAAGGLLPGHESWVRWEPYGTVAVIVPWNYPLMMAAWRCAPALAAGNSVVVKPAQTTPDSAVLLAEHAQEALGEGVLQCLPGDRETGRLLVDSAVDMIAFTGSARAGAQVAARAGTRHTSLELGGNSPVVVLPDAPENTWADLAAACTYNAGQSCAAPARVITLAGHYHDAVDALGEAMAARRAGREFGPLNNADQAARYDRIVAASGAGRTETAPPATAPGEENGYWRGATVLADLPEDSPALAEEVFGPLLTVQQAKDEEHAVQLAGSVEQALAASVWTADLDRGLALARRLDAGEVWLNCHLAQTAELPHGGRGASGQGTDLSILALRDYRRPKTITARLRWPSTP
ncbi:aldehyde dehydrogenase family protein [Streptomyces sp. RB6PN25]|uniref:Aldehyde dehydrogenase family protein n=1 Tax=Streptomyces humicola TaxID=2953240 RepID=A0ABT1PPL0_9ACTN|nr:aldehyde dehydrogenase family protein [Streptomyces humicola]MCQ4079623.1 aldehyde dehydrogenase family protein [Streptomyces humicola]